MTITKMLFVISHYKPNPFSCNKFQLHSKGILFVPSLNTAGDGHFVFWGGPGKLFDPSNELCYTPQKFPIVISHILCVDKSNIHNIKYDYTNNIELIDSFRVK